MSNPCLGFKLQRSAVCAATPILGDIIRSYPAASPCSGVPHRPLSPGSHQQLYPPWPSCSSTTTEASSFAVVPWASPQRQQRPLGPSNCLSTAAPLGFLLSLCTTSVPRHGIVRGVNLCPLISVRLVRSNISLSCRVGSGLHCPSLSTISLLGVQCPRLWAHRAPSADFPGRLRLPRKLWH